MVSKKLCSINSLPSLYAQVARRQSGSKRESQFEDQDLPAAADEISLLPYRKAVRLLRTNPFVLFNS